jgi:hypothetical protein
LFPWTSVVANGVPRSAARQRIESCSVFRAPHPTPERVRHLLNVPPPNNKPHQLGGAVRSATRLFAEPRCLVPQIRALSLLPSGSVPPTNFSGTAHCIRSGHPASRLFDHVQP